MAWPWVAFVLADGTTATINGGAVVRIDPWIPNEDQGSSADGPFARLTLCGAGDPLDTLIGFDAAIAMLTPPA